MQEGRFVSYSVYESLRRQTAVGLPVTVEFRVVNPLNLQIEIHNLRLFGRLIPSSPTKQEATSGNPSKAPFSEASQDVDFSMTDVELEPTASATVRLTATPLNSGRLLIEGETGCFPLSFRAFHFQPLLVLSFGVLQVSLASSLVSCKSPSISVFTGGSGWIAALIYVTVILTWSPKRILKRASLVVLVRAATRCSSGSV